MAEQHVYKVTNAQNWIPPREKPDDKYLFASSSETPSGSASSSSSTAGERKTRTSTQRTKRQIRKKEPSNISIADTSSTYTSSTTSSGDESSQSSSSTPYPDSTLSDPYERRHRKTPTPRKKKTYIRRLTLRQFHSDDSFKRQWKAERSTDASTGMAVPRHYTPENTKLIVRGMLQSDSPNVNGMLCFMPHLPEVTLSLVELEMASPEERQLRLLQKAKEGQLAKEKVRRRSRRRAELLRRNTYLHTLKRELGIISSSSTTTSSETGEYEAVIYVKEDMSLVQYLLGLGYTREDCVRELRRRITRLRLRVAFREGATGPTETWHETAASSTATAPAMGPNTSASTATAVGDVIAGLKNAHLRILRRQEAGQVRLFGDEFTNRLEELVESTVTTKKMKFISEFIEFFTIADEESQATRNVHLNPKEIDLVRHMTVRYLPYIRHHVHIIAKYIGRGLLRSKKEIDGAYAYIIRDREKRLNMDDFNLFCGVHQKTTPVKSLIKKIWPEFNWDLGYNDKRDDYYTKKRTVYTAMTSSSSGSLLSRECIRRGTSSWDGVRRKIAEIGRICDFLNQDLSGAETIRNKIKSRVTSTPVENRTSGFRPREHDTTRFSSKKNAKQPSAFVDSSTRVISNSEITKTYFVDSQYTPYLTLKHATQMDKRMTNKFSGRKLRQIPGEHNMYHVNMSRNKLRTRRENIPREREIRETNGSSSSGNISDINYGSYSSYSISPSCEGTAEKKSSLHDTFATENERENPMLHVNRIFFSSDSSSRSAKTNSSDIAEDFEVSENNSRKRKQTEIALSLPGHKRSYGKGMHIYSQTLQREKNIAGKPISQRIGLPRKGIELKQSSGDAGSRRKGKEGRDDTASTTSQTNRITLTHKISQYFSRIYSRIRPRKINRRKEKANRIFDREFVEES